ncbi:hypothetical protein K7X08_002721 [Anisodus acutangulus]|uniref:DUF155 domain-containing protein n=3 Tax=Solanaceae TaxID=4070 RepID=A0A9Q1MCG6_9SOLA|nr:hypothetical protein K7X08_002721 [Anisodus acutangulus]
MKSVTAMSSSIPCLNKAFRTLFTHSTTTTTNPSPFHTLCRNLQNSPIRHRPITLTFSLIIRWESHSLNHGFIKKPNFAVAKCLSSISSSAHTVDWNDAVSCSEIGEAEESALEREEDDASATAVKPYIPVRAFFFSTSVDLRSLVEQNKQNFIPPSSRMTNYVVLRFGDTKKAPTALGANLSGSDCCYMVVFQYGSIVLFNVSDHEVDGYLKIVERHASGLLPEMRKDEYEVREKPTLSTWMQGGLDYIMLQYMNIDGIRTIGSVLGQSIALDYYVRQVDGMVAEFTDINRGMEKTGTFTMERKKLFQLVGKANSNLADVILKLGLFERSDIAWKDAKYAQIWEYLRDEFELTQRFASLDFKLKFVEHNIRFLQEILQNRKSDFLEWLIIILIGAEILISVYDIAHKSSIALRIFLENDKFRKHLKSQECSVEEEYIGKDAESGKEILIGDVKGKNKENSESHRRYHGRIVQKYLPKVLSSGKVVEYPSATHNERRESHKGVPGDNKKGEGLVVKVQNQFGALITVEEREYTYNNMEADRIENEEREEGKIMNNGNEISSEDSLISLGDALLLENIHNGKTIMDGATQHSTEVQSLDAELAQAEVEDGGSSPVSSIATDEGHAYLEAQTSSSPNEVASPTTSPMICDSAREEEDQTEGVAMRSDSCRKKSHDAKLGREENSQQVDKFSQESQQVIADSNCSDLLQN